MNILRITAALSGCLLISGQAASCATAAASNPKLLDAAVAVTGVVSNANDFWDLRPVENDLVFIGAAPSRRSREETIAFALADAAKKVAYYHSVSGSFDLAQVLSNGYNDIQIGRSASMDEAIKYEQYIELLSYSEDADILETKNTLFLKAHYAASATPNILYNRSPIGSKPDWVTHPLGETTGFLTATGHANHRYYDGDTFNEAYKDAFFSLIQIIDKKIIDNIFSIAQRDGAKNLNTTIFRSTATLEGFYIMDVWIDSEKQNVWTLAVANGGNNEQ
jgi:hypothetical protein